MATVQTKKTFKLNVMGLIKWESENLTFKEIAIILGIVMCFILLMVIILKLYVVPTLGTQVIINKIGTGIQKIIKSRSP